MFAKSIRNVVNLSKSIRHISLQTIDPKIIKAEYAVRGAVVNKAMEYESKILKGEHLPFSKLIYCNIGNPQQLKQKPLTYLRQVLSILEYPELMNQRHLFPDDVRERATRYLNEIPGGIGAYSNSQGVGVVRQEIAEFLSIRDGYIGDPNHIYLTDGASTAIKYIMNLLISNPNDGIMLPIPQYPLYSATLSLLGGATVPYYLNEESGWSIDINEISKQLDIYKKKGINIRGLVVINPGNPTGQCLSTDNMREILLFCAKNNITILADEVYQDNIYSETKKFHSFRQVYHEMHQRVHKIELASFHSTSKGYYGECGRRGGYMELNGFSQPVLDVLYKLLSINLCSNVAGQVAMGIVCNPPKPEDQSYHQFTFEKNHIIDSLRRRAHLLQNALNGFNGISCQPIEGALYAFPNIKIPNKAIKEAEKLNIAPDLFYCLKLLEQTGIVTVPGSGFLQRDGTYHYRTTILPPEEDMNHVIRSLKHFHEDFTEEYQ